MKNLYSPWFVKGETPNWKFYFNVTIFSCVQVCISLFSLSISDAFEHVFKLVSHLKADTCLAL